MDKALRIIHKDLKVVHKVLINKELYYIINKNYLAVDIESDSQIVLL
jgi:hypothetical protein